MAAHDYSIPDKSWTLLTPYYSRGGTGEPSLDDQVHYSMESVCSADMFGYGELPRSKTRVKLIYGSAGDYEDAVLTLEQADALMLEYAAGMSTDTQNTNTPSLLVQKLHDNSMNAAQVDTTTDRGYITIRLDADTDVVQDADDFKDKMVQIIKSLSNELIVKLVEVPEDKYLYALKHFSYAFQNHPTVRMYKVEAEHDVAFVVQSKYDEDIRVVGEHIEVTEGQVVCQSLNLNEQEKLKLNVLMNDIPFYKTNVDFNDGELSITGFAEDVQESILTLQKQMRTHSSEIRNLDAWTISQFKDKRFVDKMVSFIRKKNWKVRWKTFEENVIVVGTTKRHVELATDLIHGQLATIRDEIDLALYLSLWERFPRAPADANPAPVTVIKTKPELADRVVKSITNAGITESTLSDKGLKWLYFLKLTLKEIVEDYEHLPFCNTHSDAVVILKGSQDDIGEFKKRMQDVHVEKLWIVHEHNVAALERIPEYTDLPHIRRVKKGVDIRIELGRIEKQQVDVIVNSAGSNFDVDDDKTIATSIFKTAGDSAKVCLKETPKPIAAGNVIIGEPGKLPCKNILHAFLDRYNNEKKTDSKKLLNDVVHHCLAKTLSKGYRSLALPALCAGVHQYPVDVVVETMLDAIINFINGPGRVLDTVCIVCREQDKKKAFDESVKRRQQAMRRQGACLVKELPWPTSQYCCIVAETVQMVTDIENKLNDDLKQQTQVKVVIDSNN